jgi:hypothetical protein
MLASLHPAKMIPNPLPFLSPSPHSGGRVGVRGKRLRGKHCVLRLRKRKDRERAFMDTGEIAAKEDLRPLDLDDLDPEEGPYCMSYGFESGPLIRSIREVGVLNPPLLAELGEGRRAVVTGFRRIRAMREMGLKKVPVRILQGSGVTPLRCLLINLHDNLATRRLNPVEVGMFLNRLSTHLPEGRILESYLPLLDLPSHRETFLFYTRLERELDREIKRELAQGRVSLHVVKLLMDLDRESRTAAFSLFQEAGLNSNQQKQCVEILFDLFQLTGKKISPLLEEESLRALLSDTKTNKPQKARALLQNLREQRFPRLAEAERKFKETVTRMDLPAGVKMEPPPYFEGSNYRLEILFTEGDDVRKKLESLLRKDALTTFRHPWERA